MLQGLKSIVAHDRGTTALLLAHIGEVEARRLYADEGFASMYDYCVRGLHFTEDMACMRIRAARMARRFPGVFDAIAEGRLTITAVCMISRSSKKLSRAATLELLTEVENKTKQEIRVLLAHRFPQPDFAPRVHAIPAQAAPTCVVTSVPERMEVQTSSCAIETESAPTVDLLAPAEPRPDRTTPLSPGRFGLQFTISEETYEKWSRVEELLAPEVPRGDYAQRLDRMCDACIEKFEKRRYGKTDKPREARPSKNPDHIPAAVKREVHERDGGQCTFESATGRRCEKRDDLQYDHIRPKACGGKSTAVNLRLRCHAHNQLEAERAFGRDFMEKKRAEARGSARSDSDTLPPML